MAIFDGLAILARARAILEDGAGTARTIVAGTYLGGLHSELPDEVAVMRAAAKPIVETSIGAPVRNPASPWVNSTISLLDVDLTVTILRAADLAADVDDDTRDVLKGAIASDVNRIAQALTWPGNMSGCGLCSDTLMAVGADPPEVVVRESSPFARAVIRFRGIARVTQAIS
jgi:hypothetical protein